MRRETIRQGPDGAAAGLELLGLAPEPAYVPSGTGQE